MKQLKFLLSLAVATMIAMPIIAQEEAADAAVEAPAAVEKSDASQMKITGEAVVEYHYTSKTAKVKDADKQTGATNGLTTDSGEINLGFGIEKGKLTANVNLELQNGDDDGVDVEDLWFNYNFGPVQLKTDLSGSIVRYNDMDDRFGNAGDLGLELSSTNSAGIGFFASINDFGYAYADDNKVVLADGTVDTAEARTARTEDRILPVFGAGVTFAIEGNVAGETVKTTDVAAGVYVDAPMKSDLDAAKSLYYDSDNDVEKNKETNNYTGFLGFVNVKQLLPVAQGMSIDLKVNYQQNMFRFAEARVNDLVEYDATNSYGGAKDKGTDSLLGITLEAGVQATKELKVGLGGAFLMGEKGAGSKDATFANSFEAVSLNVAYQTAVATYGTTPTSATLYEAMLDAKSAYDNYAVGPQFWTNGKAMAYKVGGMAEYVLMEKTTFTLGGYYQYEELLWKATAADVTAGAAIPVAAGGPLTLVKDDEYKAVTKTIDLTFAVDHKVDDNFSAGLDVEYKMITDQYSGDAWKAMGAHAAFAAATPAEETKKNETFVTVSGTYSF